MKRPARRRLACVALALAGLAGCAEPTRIPLGLTAAQTLGRLGAPTGRYPLPGGGERLQYSREPQGYEVTNIDLDAAGRVVAVTPMMDEGRFSQDIQPHVGQWRAADVLRTYGRPEQVSQVSSFDGVIWSYRYLWLNTPRLLYIYLDPDGVVQRYGVGDDLRFDDRRRW